MCKRTPSYIFRLANLDPCPVLGSGTPWQLTWGFATHVARPGSGAQKMFSAAVTSWWYSQCSSGRNFGWNRIIGSSSSRNENPLTRGLSTCVCVDTYIYIYIENRIYSGVLWHSGRKSYTVDIQPQIYDIGHELYEILYGSGSDHLQPIPDQQHLRNTKILACFMLYPHSFVD